MIRQGATSLLETDVYMPSTLNEAWRLKKELEGKAEFISGGTLLQTHWAKGLDCPSRLISLDNIKELKGWGKEQVQGQAFVRLGASTTLDFCRHKQDVLPPLLVEAAKNIAAPAIRNRGTIGGNIASRFGDALPALLVMESILTLFNGESVYVQSVKDYIEKNDQSLIISVHMPVDQSIETFYRKLCHREAFTPSIVTVAGIVRVDDNKKLRGVRVAVSGSSTQPQRLYKTEQLLERSVLTDDLLQKIVSAVKEEFNPATDAFSSASYKKTVAANLIVSKIVRLAN